MVAKLGETATQSGKNNVAFLSHFLLGDLEKCLDVLIESGRLPEAAFFARTYLPSQISRVLPQWKEQLTKVSEKAGQSLADPNEYKNLFSNFNQTLEAEQMLAKERKRRMPASMYKQVPVSFGCTYVTGLSSLGVPWHPQILADQLTLSQPRGTDYAHEIILAPPDFQTFRRPCI